MAQEQPFQVNGVKVGGVDVTGPGLVLVDKVDNEEGTKTLRFDVWLFPFLNFYGIVGQTDGEAHGPLALDLEPFFPIVCAPAIVDCLIQSQFDIEYQGIVTGGGLTLAGGYKDFFGMIDSNLTYTDLDISKTDAKAIVTSARLGWNGRMGGFTGGLWVGAMYQNINQTLDLEIPNDSGVGPPILNVVIDQETDAPLNYLVGGRWEIGKGFEALLELGFGERRSTMANLTYRF
jgi:hypothetical protein